MNKEIEELKNILKDMKKECGDKKEEKTDDEILIHIDNEKCEIKGNAPRVLTELSRLIKIIHDEMGIDKKTFETAIDFAFADNMADLVNILGEKIKDLLGELDD